MEVLYRAKATAVGGRDGKVKSQDGFIDMQLRVPKEMGGQGGAANPEDLFAAGFSACFNGATAAAARKNRVETGEVTVTSEVGIGPNGEGGFRITLKVEVNIPGVDIEMAKKLVEDAKYICPYSNAIRGNVEQEFTVTNT